MPVLHSLSGRPVSLGPKLAEGGEGRVYSIQGDDHNVAKVYHSRAPDELNRKLRAMVQLRTTDLEAAAAWPTDLLTDNSGVAGFVMPRIDAPSDMSDLTHPAAQRLNFPHVDYGFLVHVAMNMMRAAAALHASGCVIGDVNDRNVRVMRNGLVRFLDADSFQIEVRGELFSCNVGTPLFTPRELQRKTLRGIRRTPNHDAFGLAILAFQLLMCGRHPFSGRPRDGRPRTIEDAISEGMYAYSMNGHTGADPPPDVLPVSSLGPITSLFERAFTTDARPTSAEWMNALDRAQSRSLGCDRNKRHRRLTDGPCPMCRLPRDPMPDGGASAPSVDVGVPTLGELIREANGLPPLATLADRCKQPALSFQEMNSKSYAGDSGVKTAGGWIMGAGIVTAVFCPIPVEARLVAAGIGVVGGGLMLAIGSGLEESARVRRKPLQEKAANLADQARGVEMKGDAAERSVAGQLRSLKSSIDGLARTLSNAHQSLSAELSKADRTYREHLLDEHLRKYMIAKASIPDIADSRKATLASFGVETAADVTRQSVWSVPGFGQKLTQRMMAWRLKCEKSFSPPPDPRAPASWIDRIRQKHRQDVADNAAELRRLFTEYRDRHSQSDRTLADYAIRIDRARTDLRQILLQMR